MNRIIPAAPPALPAKAQDLTRYIREMPSLNDAVEGVFIKLWDIDPKFRDYLYAIHDTQAITGSLSWDDYEAVRLIQAEAETQSISLIKKEKPIDIGKSLRVVMKRYHIDRKTRRNTVAGEVVPPNGNTPSDHE